MSTSSQFFIDLLVPHKTADESPVTLASTYKALHLATSFPLLGARFFDGIGKRLRITAHGKMTTAATPGNGTFGLHWGTGADANGTAVVESAAYALAANRTNECWRVVFDVHARVLGATGTLFAVGTAWHSSTLATIPTQMLPASAPAAVTVDLTTALILSLQYKRSGSTAETMTLQDLVVESMN